MKNRKKKSYNKTFLQIKGKEKDELFNICNSGDYDMQVVFYFNELKRLVSDIMNKVITDMKRHEL